eukprot:c42982_g1_i1 orf=3-227(-)
MSTSLSNCNLHLVEGCFLKRYNGAIIFTPIGPFAEKEDITTVVLNYDRHSLPCAAELQEIKNFVFSEIYLYALLL